MTQPADDVATFAQWLKHSRRTLDLTQEELAARVGYASPTLQKIERGVRRPSRELAERLADTLAIPEQERPRFLQLARVGQVQASDLVAERPIQPFRSRPHVPAPPTTMVGREIERTVLLKHLRDSSQPLVTLVGPGGVGKTTLALHAACELADDERFPDGVAVALLAPVAVAEDVPLVIIEALGVPVDRVQPAADQLIEALRDRKLLLVLDNLEHLLGRGEGAILTRLISRILAEGPGVRLLATSRERLRLRSEQVILVGGLALPPTDAGPRVERAAAVQLFVGQAQRVVSTFAVSDQNRAAVARICRRLEGLPLAIELAASWTRALSSQEIAAEIDRSLDFLAADNHDIPNRHRSLRAALDHSWRLLDNAERHTLARLSVFRGGCDRDAASTVVGATLPILTALIDKSLVRATSVAGVTRYSVHELVRQYAAEHLVTDAADQGATALRHATYYAELLQRSIVAQTGGSNPEHWAALTENIDNLRAAWMWAATNGNGAIVIGMALGLSLLHDTFGWLLDGATLFGRAAEALRSAAPDTLLAQGFVIGWQGYFLYRAGRLNDAARQMERGVALAQAAGSTEGLANLLLHLGAVEVFSARFHEAQMRHAQAAQLADAAGDHFTRNWVTFFQAMIALFTGDLHTAEQTFITCLNLWRTQGVHRGTVAALLLLGETTRLSGRPADAEAYVRESLQISSATRDRSTIAACLRELGALALARGEYEEARYLLAESYEGMREVGDLMYAGRSRSLLVRLEVQRGEQAAARRGCAELLRLVREGLALLLAEAAYGLALILISEDSLSEALAIFIALESIPGEYATLKLAAELRAKLDGRVSAAQRTAAVELAGAQDLLPWLEHLCARQPVPAQHAPAPSPQHDAPIVASGALFIAETSEILSPREIEVLQMLIAGVSNQAIADALVISLHTAKKHVASILKKLGVATRTQAALRGRALGLAPRSPG
jgi:predicted ATPase/DNA-binding CsgD family transcriptional regulator/transcriptional regulator with XRE-family HTH domain